jgi:hypothetical protein
LAALPPSPGGRGRAGEGEVCGWLRLHATLFSPRETALLRLHGTSVPKAAASGEASAVVCGCSPKEPSDEEAKRSTRAGNASEGVASPSMPARSPKGEEVFAGAARARRSTPARLRRAAARSPTDEEIERGDEEGFRGDEEAFRGDAISSTTRAPGSPADEGASRAREEGSRSDGVRSRAARAAFATTHVGSWAGSVASRTRGSTFVPAVPRFPATPLGDDASPEGAPPALNVDAFARDLHGRRSLAGPPGPQERRGGRRAAHARGRATRARALTDWALPIAVNTDSLRSTGCD